MISKERYSVGSDDGRSISFQKEKGTFLGLDITITFRHVMAVIIIAVVFSGTSYFSNVVPRKSVPDAQEGHVVQEVQNTYIQSEKKEPIDSEGFVFAESSDVVLSKSMVLDLEDDETVGFQRLVRMAINEIYARHGQVFNAGGENDAHYQRYNWYRVTNKHIVDWNEFNDTEKTNLRLLILIEEEYGYR